MNAITDTTGAAADLIRRYGSSASLEAARRAFDAREDGDLECCAAWIAIVAKIQKLQPPRRKRGTQLN